MKKILYSEGCSWTGGHLGDNSNMLKPGLNDNQLMSKENESYRLPKLWPDKLGKLLNIENVHNAGVCKGNIEYFHDGITSVGSA